MKGRIMPLLWILLSYLERFMDNKPGRHRQAEPGPAWLDDDIEWVRAIAKIAKRRTGVSYARC